MNIAPPIELCHGIFLSGDILYSSSITMKIINHDIGPLKLVNAFITFDANVVLKLTYSNSLIISSPNNGNIIINRNSNTTINSINKAFNLLLKNPESSIPYIELADTIIDAIPLDAIKYPDPNVIKNAGVIFVDVIIGVNSSDISLLNALFNIVVMTSLDIFK